MGKAPTIARRTLTLEEEPGGILFTNVTSYGILPPSYPCSTFFNRVDGRKDIPNEGHQRTGWPFGWFVFQLVCGGLYLPEKIGKQGVIMLNLMENSVRRLLAHFAAGSRAQVEI